MTIDNEQVELLWQIRKLTIKYVKRNNLNYKIGPVVMDDRLMIPYRRYRCGAQGDPYMLWDVWDGDLRLGGDHVDLNAPKSIKEIVNEALDKCDNIKECKIKLEMSWWRRLFNRWSY